MSIQLIRQIAQQGLRIFDKGDLTEIISALGLSKNYMKRLLRLMVEQGNLVSFGNGLYTLPTELLSGGPLYSFEIALKLAKKGAISHWSAMDYHGLTDQITSKVYVTVPKEKGANLSSKRNYSLEGVTYTLIRIDPKNFWGVKSVFLGEAKVMVTDLEKTLIDGLANPELCGGFRDVLFGYERGITKVSSTILLDYAQKTSLVACKRLGWVLEKLNEYPDIQEHLLSIKMPYSQKLDASGKRIGKLNPRWSLMENI